MPYFIPEAIGADASVGVQYTDKICEVIFFHIITI